MLTQPSCAVRAVFFNFTAILLDDSLIWLNKNSGIFRVITNKKTRQATHCCKYRQFATKHRMQYIDIRVQHENCNIVQEIECSCYRVCDWCVGQQQAIGNRNVQERMSEFTLIKHNCNFNRILVDECEIYIVF